MKLEIFTSSPLQTKKLGEMLAEEILKGKSGKKALVIGLVGELGGGKTTFLQGFAKGLGIKEKILSPTFVIMKRFGDFYHLDCYRIQKTKDILGLGFKEIINNPKNIVAIEWADKISSLLPKNIILIKFEVIDEDKRSIVLTVNAV